MHVNARRHTYIKVTRGRILKSDTALAEVVSENPDPFWSETNQRVLRESIDSLERGEGQRHELIEA